MFKCKDLEITMVVFNCSFILAGTEPEGKKKLILSSNSKVLTIKVHKASDLIPVLSNVPLGTQIKC